MATADHDSSTDLRTRGGSVDGSSGSVDGSSDLSGSGREIWLDGEVLACQCPDCGAPMSIRLWLMVADCWRCGTSIELTEEQEQAALRLLRQQEESRRAETEKAATAITPTMLRKPQPPPLPKPPPIERAPKPPPPVPKPPASARPRPAAGDVPPRSRAQIPTWREKLAAGRFWTELLKDLPAWLVSLVVHLVAILLLGLWIVQTPEDRPQITLATEISYLELEGATEEPETPLPDAFEFDIPGVIEPTEGIDEQSSGKAVVDLEGIIPKLPDPVGDLPELGELSTSIPLVASGTMFAGRDPELRAEIVRREGGTTLTEAAVARGLVWLARHQNRDGSWSLHAFHRAPGANGQCTGQGVMSDTAGTALALLPFLGAGETQRRGRYREVVSKGLRWLVYHQGEDGDLRGRGRGQMYAHGLASIVLCEAYAMTRDEQLREPAQLALDYIVRAQHYPGGGWRYGPGQAGDTSMIGWQLMALRSGKMAYLDVPQRTFKGADHFLNQVKTDKLGGRYSYMPRSGPSHVMTAEALLCRQYLGWTKDHRGLKAGVKYLLENHLPDKTSNIYYWYYATQVMHHMGGKSFRKWNPIMRSVLVETQEKKGHAAGSWAPRGAHAGQGGRLYMTSLAVCTLEVYYRHMPLYRDDVLEGIVTSSEEAEIRDKERGTRGGG